MSIHGKLDVIQSLDSLLYCHFVYTYFLDASLLVLIFRIFLQLPLLSPRAHSRTLRTATGVATAELGICILIHATTEPGQPGILIDFVGNQYHSSSLRVIMLDMIIYILQVIRIFITSSLSSQLPENGTVTTLPVPAPLVSALGAESLTLMLPSTIPNDDEEDPFYRNDLVVDVGLRTSLDSVLRSSPREDAVDRLPV
ncbi:hypothetical protein BDB00DRAFT_817804 [Zychaea mexicana]|uniref:uncharacterized protein n=1 Tax=Zychaea mexicana TaxID=64656 RepID=UPI0022FE40BD|nr:uncharacterized protein BDB00DRAFT_817804 [Zychaea mexicana]KAI9494673.1 hypothetical protein BDB00DRAFT_817804 [Zychaea mexicana]